MVEHLGGRTGACSEYPCSKKFLLRCFLIDANVSVHLKEEASYRLDLNHLNLEKQALTLAALALALPFRCRLRLQTTAGLCPEVCSSVLCTTMRCLSDVSMASCEGTPPPRPFIFIVSHCEHVPILKGVLNGINL